MVKKGKKILYKDWALQWLKERKPYIKESTYANYSNIIYNHLIPVLGNYRLSIIDNHILQEMILDKYRIGRIDNKGGLSDKTIKDIGTLLKLTLKGAIKDNLIDYLDLDFRYPKKEKKNKIYTFSKKEQKKIVDYCLENLDIKNMGILLTLYSGLRIGELCALKWSDIDLKKNILSVNKTIQRIYLKDVGKSKMIISSPKTKNANRVIPLNSEFALLLKQFKTDNNNYFLSNDTVWMEPRSFRKYYYDMIQELDISNITFHSLRHTFASNCIRLGVDYKTVSELLGHSSVNITLNIYVHSQMSQKKKCINLIYRENNNINYLEKNNNDE